MPPRPEEGHPGYTLGTGGAAAAGAEVAPKPEEEEEEEAAEGAAAPSPHRGGHLELLQPLQQQRERAMQQRSREQGLVAGTVPRGRLLCTGAEAAVVGRWAGRLLLVSLPIPAWSGGPLPPPSPPG